MNTKTIIPGIILGLLLLAGCHDKPSNQSSHPIDQPSTLPVLSEHQPSEPETGTGHQLKVHFVDVGQADAIFIQTPENENILIDGGGNDDEQFICEYLASQQVEKIKVLIGTHPHEDHIGGLDAVINRFPVENVYLPRVTHNTEAFKDLLQAIKNRGLKVKTAQSGVDIPLTNLNCQILSPAARAYESLNDYSAVIKLNYGQQSFLFCGDAGAAAESDMLAGGYDLQSNVIKIGHHGSISSTSKSFLRAVAPDYAIISCGQHNPYGHPHTETLARLKTAGINILRIDQLGTIIMTADGKNNIELSTDNKGYGDLK